MDMTPQAWPDWYDGRHINEVLFCQQFLDKHPMKCVRGRLFTVDGLIEDEGQIGNLILPSEKPRVSCPPISPRRLQTYLPASNCKHIRRRCPLRPTVSMFPTERTSWTAALPPTRATATTA